MPWRSYGGEWSQYMVSRKDLRMGMGPALHMAGVGCDDCLCRSCYIGSLCHQTKSAYGTVPRRCGWFINSVRFDLLVERRKTELAMGRQEIDLVLFEGRPRPALV